MVGGSNTPSDTCHRHRLCTGESVKMSRIPSTPAEEIDVQYHYQQLQCHPFDKSFGCFAGWLSGPPPLQPWILFSDSDMYKTASLNKPRVAENWISNSALTNSCDTQTDVAKLLPYVRDQTLSNIYHHIYISEVERLKGYMEIWAVLPIPLFSWPFPRPSTHTHKKKPWNYQ